MTLWMFALACVAPVEVGDGESAPPSPLPPRSGEGLDLDAGFEDTGDPVEDTADASVVDTGPFEDTAPPPPCGIDASPGLVYTIWPDAHTGDEHTAEPKTDANDGAGGDNPEFRRYNVARAHNDYWYSSSFQESGEPDPNSVQYVDYTPDFGSIGVGRYEVVAHYRQTENRAAYEAWYTVHHGGTTTTTYKDQREGHDYESISLGEYDLCPGDFLRIEDPGPNSITFNQVEFRFLGPS